LYNLIEEDNTIDEQQKIDILNESENEVACEYYLRELCREPQDRNLAYHSFIWINTSITINNELEFGSMGENEQEYAKLTAGDSSEVKPGLPALITNTLKQIKPPLSAKTKVAFKTIII